MKNYDLSGSSSASMSVSSDVMSALKERQMKDAAMMRKVEMKIAREHKHEIKREMVAIGGAAVAVGIGVGFFKAKESYERAKLDRLHAESEFERSLADTAKQRVITIYGKAGATPDRIRAEMENMRRERTAARNDWCVVS